MTEATTDSKPNIVVFLWDNLAWGEVGCYGGGILRGAPTPRIDSLAADGMQLLNFNVEAQCIPSRSASTSASRYLLFPIARQTAPSSTHVLSAIRRSPSRGSR